jgi:hypothetical protein
MCIACCVSGELRTLVRLEIRLERWFGVVCSVGLISGWPQDVLSLWVCSTLDNTKVLKTWKLFRKLRDLGLLKKKKKKSQT